jgi:integrase
MDYKILKLGKFEYLDKRENAALVEFQLPVHSSDILSIYEATSASKRQSMEIPDEIIWKLLEVSKKHCPDISFAICLQAFCGIRTGVVCRIGQAAEPRNGGGYVYTIHEEKWSSFSIYLNDKYPARFAKVDGQIKNIREQPAHGMFLPVLQQYHELHIERLKSKNLHNGYGPLFVEDNGKALTVESYTRKFKKLINTHLVKALSDSNEIELAELVLKNKLTTYSLRNWYTFQLIQNGETPLNISKYLGNKSVE